MSVATSTKATVTAVRENLVEIEFANGAIRKNEVGYIRLGEQRLMAETLRIRRNSADMQVFEDTRGVTVGLEVDMTGEMLSVELGPGLLGRVFDGLQSSLEEIASEHGFFLPRGSSAPAIDPNRQWPFTPSVAIGDRVVAGQTLGTVPEGPLVHKVMAPFDQTEPGEVIWIRSGHYAAGHPIARIRRDDGEEYEVSLQQRWPVRVPVPSRMVQDRIVQRLYPSELMPSSIRIIDTFFPIAKGGTACIPGPFGAGKTVLQSLIARYAAIDVVVVVACGERAGEVVETITQFPETADPRTGGSLMDRTIIICNTSAMPVAARESSIYTGITIAEYYRQMGNDVLLIADSTSRWAQSMRETSGRMEEIPGEEAFPAYLDSAIKNVYERAGLIESVEGRTGSLTLVGTVSPAGGNFDEPVTQATLGTVKTFLGLSSDRAYRRCYPAIDPLISWSRYRGQLREWFEQNIDREWNDDVERMIQLLKQGDSIRQMMQVTGEEGVSLEDFVLWLKADFIDMVYLQQDAFDDVDVSTPVARQLDNFRLMKAVVDKDYGFAGKEEARDYFTKQTSRFKNYNYSAADSADSGNYASEIREALEQQG